jgi:hypothetical protein
VTSVDQRVNTQVSVSVAVLFCMLGEMAMFGGWKRTNDLARKKVGDA